MPMLDVTEGYTPLEPGMYPAIIRGITVENRGHGPSLKWVLTIEGQEDDQWAWSTADPTPSNKVGRWIQAAGGTLVPGQGFNTDTIVGNRVTVALERVQTDKGPKNRVGDIHPLTAVPSRHGDEFGSAEEPKLSARQEAQFLPLYAEISTASSAEDLHALVDRIRETDAEVQAMLREPYAKRLASFTQF